MSLLDKYKQTFIVMEKTRVADGAGGFSIAWTDGETIELAQRFDSSMTARKAEKDGVTSTLLAKKP